MFCNQEFLKDLDELKRAIFMLFIELLQFHPKIRRIFILERSMGYKFDVFEVGVEYY